ncbi:MAG: hypothetical protein AB9869_15625 [Verrucomicrobiia bacterium]
MIRSNTVTYALTLGGSLLLLIGLFGSFFPNFMGLHLSAFVNLAHLASGFVALFFGLTSTSQTAARTTCVAIGTFYSLAGLAGFLFLGLGDALIYFALGAGFVTAALMQPLPSAVYSARQIRRLNCR